MVEQVDVLGRGLHVLTISCTVDKLYDTRSGSLEVDFAQVNAAVLLEAGANIINDLRDAEIVVIPVSLRVERNIPDQDGVGSPQMLSARFKAVDFCEVVAKISHDSAEEDEEGAEGQAEESRIIFNPDFLDRLRDWQLLGVSWDSVTSIVSADR